MILLYTTFLTLLKVAQFLVGRRVAGLERKYVRVAKEADALVHALNTKPGNASRYDPFTAAKRQYQLGVLAQKRDRVEAKYTAWQLFRERFGRFVAAAGSWKGRKLPYTFGVLDVAAVLAAVDWLGVGDVVSVRNLVALVTAWLNG